MARGPITEEQKAKMQAGRTAAKLRKATTTVAPQPANDDVLAKLMARIDELESAQLIKPTPEAALTVTAQMQNVSVGPQGIQGIQYKYPVDKGYYPDPTERLFDEPRLKQMAMRENYIFSWDVEGVIYESHNITYSEPRFVIRLGRRLFDEEGNERNDQVALAGQLYMHEDELVARIACERLELKFDSHEEMMNEIRYYRIKQWLLDLFYTPKPRVRSGNQQIVVDGKIINMEDRESFTDADSGATSAASIQRQVQI